MFGKQKTEISISFRVVKKIAKVGEWIVRKFRKKKYNQYEPYNPTPEDIKEINKLIERYDRRKNEEQLIQSDTARSIRG